MELATAAEGLGWTKHLSQTDPEKAPAFPPPVPFHQSWNSKTKGSRVRLGALQLLERVGRGAVGEVWRAKHSRQGRLVAVKFLTPEKRVTPGPEALNNELHIASSLHHHRHRPDLGP